MRGVEMTFKITLVSEECCRCGMMFGIPHNVQERLINTRETFYCPAGHPQSYTGEREVDKLRRQLSAANQQIDTLSARVRHVEDQREGAERILKATERELNRTKKRVANGVCPCCNRTFQNLSRHMAGQHPEYKE